MPYPQAASEIQPVTHLHLKYLTAPSNNYHTQTTQESEDGVICLLFSLRG